MNNVSTTDVFMSFFGNFQKNFYKEVIYISLDTYWQLLYLIILYYSELNVAAVDEHLMILVSKNVFKNIQIYVNKCEQMVDLF